MISDLPSYVKYWRNKFSRRLDEIGPNYQEKIENQTLVRKILTEYTTCLQMGTEMNESRTNVEIGGTVPSSKNDYYFLSDVLPEDKVIQKETIIAGYEMD